MAGFLNRWAKKKAGLESSEPSKDDVQPDSKLTQTSSDVQAPVRENQTGESTTAQASEQEQMPTFEDVLKLTKDSDYSAYVKPGIDPGVQQAALQKLFSDPRYNVMDGLDIYIDDYSKPDPLPTGMLERMVQSDMLNLFRKKSEVILKDRADTELSDTLPNTENQTLEAEFKTDLTSTDIQGATESTNDLLKETKNLSGPSSELEQKKT